MFDIRAERSDIMPNHVKNVLKFKKLKPDDIENIVHLIAIESEDDPKSYWIDFNKIIPEPKYESECPDEFKVNKESHIAVNPEKPWFDWYKWRIHYWDTKWGAYDCYSIMGKSYVTFVFSTAWSIAYPVIERLHLLGYDFELRYADEDYGSNCGIITYESEQGFEHQDESSFRDPRRFAINLWEKY